MKQTILGFSISQVQSGKKGVGKWFAYKKINSKKINIYIGKNPDLAEEKINAWLDKHPEVKEQLKQKYEIAEINESDKEMEEKKLMDYTDDDWKQATIDSKVAYGTTMINHIHINFLEKHPDNEKLLPPLSEDERELLRKKMEKDLEPQPFVIIKSEQSKFWVLDGNNRLSVLKEMGFKSVIPCIIKKDMTLEEQRTYIERCSLGRRNLTKEAKVEIAQRQVARGISQSEVAKVLGLSQAWVSENTSEIKEIRQEAEKEAIQTLRNAGVTRKEVSDIVGVSKNTVIKNEKTSTKIIIFDNFGTPLELPKLPPGIVINQVKFKLSEDCILEKAKAREVEKPKIEAPKVFLKQETFAEPSPVEDIETTGMREWLAHKDKIITNLKYENEKLKDEIDRLKKENLNLKEENVDLKIQKANFIQNMLNNLPEDDEKEEKEEEVE